MVPQNSSTSCRWHQVYSTMAACFSGPFPAWRSRYRTSWARVPIWSSYAQSPPLHGAAELHHADFSATLNWIRCRTMSAGDLKTIFILILDFRIAAGFASLWQQLCTFRIAAVFNSGSLSVNQILYLRLEWEKSIHILFTVLREFCIDIDLMRTLFWIIPRQTSICFIFM